MIDLRSDTVTKPSPAMLDFMSAAEVGDDVYGEDPTVNRLESEVAAMAGKESAVFVSSGTQSNLLALLSHCQRGDEYIAGQQAHTYRYEAGGAAVLGGIAPQPLDFNESGELPLDAVAAAIKPDDFHFAKTRLVCLENTMAGKVLDLNYLSQFAQFVKHNNLLSHLDGARVFNAAVAQEVPLTRITDAFDSVSICFSKGLGAPVGSVLAGSAATIAKARRYRKMLGGGMRQSGILAAAALYALEHNVASLADDHRHAQALFDAVSDRLPCEKPQTNMLHLKLPDAEIPKLKDHLAAHNIRVSSARLVFHRDINDRDLTQIIDAFIAYPAPS